ncbi:phage integrase family protein [Synechococcus sp. SYN20]|nr:phage integrase family protein [Synechococcus sp. SYN20]
MGNKATICRVLPCDTTNRGSVAAQQAWMQVHTPIEAAFTAAEAAYQAGITQTAEVTPVSPKNAAGIGAEPWRNLLNAGDNGQITTDMEDLLARLVLEVATGLASAKEQGTSAPIQQAKANVTERLLSNVLSQLQITPNSQAYQQIQQRLFGYLPMMEGDVAKRAQGDFSPGDIETKAPALPERKVTWEQLVEALQLDAGGIRHIDGVGITEDRIKRYWQVISEIQQSSDKSFPNELDVSDARRYVQELQRSSWAIRSQQKRVGVMQKLFKIAIQYGYTDTNPFQSMAIRAPKGSEQGTYRSFTRDELVLIFNHIKQKAYTEKSLVPLVLLATGARMSEITQLRHGDLKKTDAGVWYLDMVHDADGEFPHPLKTEQQNERHVPLHPVVIQSGFLDLFKAGENGYIFAGSKDPSVWSEWFQKILKREGIYERKVTTTHSIRNTSIDAWRMAGITPEFRRAFTGHTSKDVQENTYGVGLKFMPDLLYKEIIKVDWSWIP